MSPENANSSEAVAPQMSEAARLAGVLTDPKRAFHDIVTGPRWWVPLILMILFSLTFNTVYSRRVGWERFMTQTFESNPRTQNMPADQRAQAIARATQIASVSSYVMAVVGSPMGAVIIAAVLLLVFNVAMSAQLKFKQVFGVTSYALIPGLVSTALTILVLFLKNPDDFNLQNPLAFNEGAFLDPQTTAKWLVSLATSVDLFAIWIVLLLAVGMSALVRRMEFKRALAGVMAPWLIVILLRAAWTAAFS